MRRVGDTLAIMTKDGAWITETVVSKFFCTECGVFMTSEYPMNDQQVMDVIREHARDVHRGINR
jgi:hypothetical protein